MPTPLFAARLWSSGCELQGDAPGSATTGMEFDVTTSGAGSTAQISATTLRTGLSSCRNAATGSGWTVFSQQFLGTAAGGPYYFRFYMYIESSPSTNVSIALWINSSDSRNFLRLNSDRTLDMMDADDTTVLDSYATPLSTGTWYRVELKYDSALNGMEAKLDGTTILGPADCTGCGSVNELDFGLNDYADAPTGTIYFDDLAVNDSSGGSQTSWPGVGSIVHMQPDGVGDNSGCGAGDYSSVDEVTPDDGTTTCTLTTDGGGDILDVTAESPSSAGIDSYDTVSLVQVGMREATITGGGTGSQSKNVRVKSASGGTVSSGTATTHNDTTYRTNGDVAPRNYTLTSYTDPTTSIAWTPTGTNSLDNMQVGITSVDGNPDISVSTIWALVEYVDGSPPAALDKMRALLNGGRFKVQGNRFKLQSN